MRHFLLVAALWLAGCGGGRPTVIDGSSPESFRESMAAARSDLSPADRARFEAAVKVVQASAFAKADDRADMEARVRRQLDGQTAEQVIADYRRKQRDIADRAADELFDLKRQVTKEIQDLKNEEPAP